MYAYKDLAYSWVTSKHSEDCSEDHVGKAYALKSEDVQMLVQNILGFEPGMRCITRESPGALLSGVWHQARRHGPTPRGMLCYVGTANGRLLWRPSCGVRSYASWDIYSPTLARRGSLRDFGSEGVVLNEVSMVKTSLGHREHARLGVCTRLLLLLAQSPP